jgi:hypothetical protein
LAARPLGAARLVERASLPLVPVNDQTTGLPLLKLPDGFRYVSFGRTAEPLADGTPTPAAHDGMAVVKALGDRLVLVRNHEVKSDRGSFARRGPIYDPAGAGGCTILEFDAVQGLWLGARAGFAGTIVNCAGGPTPWGTWLTCEETVAGPESGELRKPHGYVFEVPVDGKTDPAPLRAMGRFVHEAAAVDPRSGYVYLTEDRPTRPSAGMVGSGFYRFRPTVAGRLARGGTLEMLKVAGTTNADLTGRRSQVRLGPPHATQWVEIADPDRAHSPETNDTQGVFKQGYAQGAAFFARLEGCWYDSGKIFFVSTSGGGAGKGQVWTYDPEREQLTLIFESSGAAQLNNPDNVTVHPALGTVVLCEDGGGVGERMHLLNPDGRLRAFAENSIRSGLLGPSDYRTGEWAGACFSPDGAWLFANIQKPGITFAITGPWEELRKT